MRVITSREFSGKLPNVLFSLYIKHGNMKGNGRKMNVWIRSGPQWLSFSSSLSSKVLYCVFSEVSYSYSPLFHLKPLWYEIFAISMLSMSKWLGVKRATCTKLCMTLGSLSSFFTLSGIFLLSDYSSLREPGALSANP